tara:strand:- start:37 stop:837 length:801 start_codon:yes stop_codon:yes gene_type:complete
MRIDMSSGGFVGIGATTVDRQLHLEADNSTTYSSSDFDQAYNLLKIENNNTTNNVATGLQFLVGTNGSASITTTRTGDGAASLCFGTRGGGARAERMRIDSSGHLMLNTTSARTGTNSITLEGGNSFLMFRATGTGSLQQASFMRSTDATASQVGSIFTSSVGTSFNQTSDYRLKENVNYSFDATTRLKKLKPARFNFIIDADTTVDGFLAHEVSSIVPEAITGEKDAVDADGNIDPQGIDQSKLVPLLVKTIQELEARITALEGA